MSVWSMTVKHAPSLPGHVTSNADYGQWFSSSSPSSRNGGTSGIRHYGSVVPSSPGSSAMPSGANLPPHKYVYAKKITSFDQPNDSVYSIRSRAPPTGDSQPTRSYNTGGRTTVIISRRPSDTPRNSPDSDQRNVLDMKAPPLNPIEKEQNKHVYGEASSRQTATSLSSSNRDFNVTKFSLGSGKPLQVDFKNNDKTSTNGYISNEYNNQSVSLSPRSHGLQRANTLNEIESPRKLDRRDIQDLSLRRTRSFHDSGATAVKPWNLPADGGASEFGRGKPRYSSFGRVPSRYVLPSVPSSNAAQGMSTAETSGHRSAGCSRTTPSHWPEAEVGSNHATTRPSTINGAIDSRVLYSQPTSFGKPTYSNIANNPHNLDNFKENEQIVSLRMHAPSFQIQVSTPRLTNEPTVVPTFPSRVEEASVSPPYLLPADKYATFPGKYSKATRSILKKKSAYSENQYETWSLPGMNATSASRYDDMSGIIPSLRGEYKFNYHQEPGEFKKTRSLKRVTFAV